MKKISVAFFMLISVAIFAQTNTAHEAKSNPWSSARPDGHAPIGVMADHMHHKGGFMVGYRFMSMQMKNLRNDSRDVNNDFVHQNYMVSPKEMTMNMHMLSAMYAPSNKVSLMAMANYVANDMDLRTKNGADFSTKSNGFGDLSLSAMYQFFNRNHHSFHGQLGVVIPTGSTNEKDVTAMSNGEDVLLPYAMQTGSGSFSGLLSFTYLWQQEVLSGGVQAKTLVPLNENDKDYRLGNEYGLTSWLAYRAGEYLSFSVRGQVNYTGEIDGENPALHPMMVTTANTANSGGLNLNYALGANFVMPKNTLKGLRFAAEMVLPAYQEPNGVQLKQSYTFNFGAQYAF